MFYLATLHYSKLAKNMINGPKDQCFKQKFKLYKVYCRFHSSYYDIVVAKCQNIKDLSFFFFFWHLATLHFIEVSFIVTTCSNSWPWWFSDHLYNLLHNMSSFCAHFVVFSYIENILHFYKIHVFLATPSLEKYISPSCSHLICWGQGIVYHQP